MSDMHLGLGTVHLAPSTSLSARSQSPKPSERQSVFQSISVSSFIVPNGCHQSSDRKFEYHFPRVH